MELLLTSNTTALSYWLNWRVLLCAICVFTPMFVAAFLIWKYDYSDFSDSKREGTQQEKDCISYDDEVWRPCVKEIHPIYLMVFRIIAFCLLLGAVTLDVVVHGCSLFYYYTQWTFTLVTIYFGVGSLLSIYGCYWYRKIYNGLNVHNGTVDAERGLYMPLKYGETAKEGKMVKRLNHQGEECVLQMKGMCGYAFEVLFQVTAGSVMLTDCIYWFVIFPFLNIKDYEPNFLTILSHSLNLLLLGDMALNSLRFPWFRISYFILWTGFYVIFQWVVHACFSIWWPYPFLDLSSPYAPLWYLVVAMMHIPCSCAFALFVKTKHYALSRWFPQSNLFSR